MHQQAFKRLWQTLLDALGLRGLVCGSDSVLTQELNSTLGSRARDVAKVPRFTASFTEAVSCRDCAGPLPTHSSQKGGRAEGGISPAGRSSRREERGRESGQGAGQAGRKKEWQGRKRPSGGTSTTWRWQIKPSPASEPLLPVLESLEHSDKLWTIVLFVA